MYEMVRLIASYTTNESQHSQHQQLKWQSALFNPISIYFVSDNLVDGWNGCQEMKVGAVSVVGEGAARPVLVAGINITGNGSTVSPLVQAMNNVNLGVDITKVSQMSFFLQ